MLVTLVLLLACPSPSANPEPAVPPKPYDAPPGVPGELMNAPAVRSGTLEGTVIKKAATMSAEAWMAGGGEYYVLDVGSAAVADRTADVGVILRPTELVSAAELDKLVGQRVVVEGTYVSAHPAGPMPADVQYPMGPDGQPAPTGAGFEVSSIKTAGP
jgi:hypothetical protein